MVIGKSRNPRKVPKNRKNLSIIDDYNNTAWMTNKYFEEYLTLLNKKMAKENRNIIVFIGNCVYHRQIKFSNLKTHFLPRNITSVLQPINR